MKFYNKEKGFSILAVILVIVAVIVAIGIWALSGQTNTSNASNRTNDIQASTLINDSVNIKLAFDKLVINGANSYSVVFIPNVASTATAPNILDTVNGITLPKVNPNAIKLGAIVPEGMWVYNPNNFQGRLIGGTLGDVFDHTVVVAGIKKSICEKINYTLYGSNSIPILNIANSASVVTGATLAAPTTNAPTLISGLLEPAGWMTGCIGTNAGGDDNFFFKILKAN